MKSNRIIGMVALTGLALALTGCVVTSVYPFYLEKDLAFEPALLGDWIQGQTYKEHWKFERDGETGYRVTYSLGAGSSVMQAHLFKLRGQTFLDLVTPEPKDDGLLPAIPAHALWLVALTGAMLNLEALNDDWLGRFLEKNPRAIRHHIVQSGGDKRIVLTADTAELQRFVLQHLKTEGAWGGCVKLQLDPASSPSH